MMELGVWFVAGFLGSSHCVGMCGPFALLLGASGRSGWGGLSRQGLYSLGRVFTYAVLGAAAGFGGQHLAEWAPSLLNVPATLAIVAGVFLIYQGLKTAGVWPQKQTTAGSGPCLAGGLLANFLRSPAPMDVFLAGIFTGFLPCGLVYGFLGLAASQQSIPGGLLTMVMFGLGTVPVMAAIGIGGQAISVARRTQLLRIAAWCVVLAGGMSIARGVNYVGLASAEEAQEACPLCTGEEVAPSPAPVTE